MQLLRAGGCPRGGQNRGAAPQRELPGFTHTAQDVHRQPPEPLHHAPRAQRVHHRADPRHLRAPRGDPGIHLGAELLRPVGRRARQGSRQQG